MATDIAVLTVEGGELKLLLTTAESPTFKDKPVIPGGLVGITEKTHEAAKRILKNSLRSVSFYSEQLFTFDDPKRDPNGRVVSIAYLMLVPGQIADSLTLGHAWWQNVNKLPKLGYDHNVIAKKAIERLKGKLTYTNIVFGLMSEEFTLTDLQTVYETILGEKMDKRNFRKKILSLKILRKLPKVKKGEANRPAKLYEFKTNILDEIKIL